MTDRKNNKLSIERLIEDKEFVSLVKSANSVKQWNRFLEEHAESRTEILQAREIICVINEKNKTLDKERRYKLWRDISNYEKEFKQRNNFRRITSYFKVAASILLIAAIGTLVYVEIRSNDSSYQFANSQIQEEVNPLLILSSGEEVEIQKNDPNITVLKDQNAILVDDDSIMANNPVVDKKTQEIRFNEVIVPYGKKSKLILSDGTKVWLNAGSRLAFPQHFSGKIREVFLEGEGYFEVTKNGRTPFIVSTNNIKVEVLGTKFDICAYKTDISTETVLIEGRVNVWDSEKVFRNKYEMLPGQKATFDRGNKDIDLSFVENPERYIAWIEGWYSFSNEDLVQVFKKLERYYKITFDYDETVISKTLPISGKLDLKDSLNEVMVVLSGVAKFEYEIDGEIVKVVK
ncbi:FecR family protein [Sunxiuqinia sp. A32]|uniref:FecR family protein n=1 Tax=Sunxiuqinia sp. A32 TaxID=3461496 RepID=UPI0040453AC1